VKLYTFWRSQAAFRVRIALNLKGLTREDIVINLDRGDQFKPEYKAQNLRRWSRPCMTATPSCSSL
jgi:maleylacetoacetate isomerase